MYKEWESPIKMMHKSDDIKFNTSLITSTVGIPVVLSEAKVLSRLKIDKMRYPYIYIYTVYKDI